MAKKIRLRLEELAVESYATGDGAQQRGTVHGHLYWSDPRVCAHTADWHCTVNEAFCTKPNACPITRTEPGHCAVYDTNDECV